MNEMEQQIQPQPAISPLWVRKTSVDQIAREAGIGKGTIYNYFEIRKSYLGVVLGIGET